MPKEIIRDSLPYGDGPEECLLSVSWGRNIESVQIATTLVDKSTHDHITREVDGGWFLNLDRPAINHLIRVLRRARDQAYGADE